MSDPVESEALEAADSPAEQAPPTARASWQLVEDALHAGAGPLAERAVRFPHWFADAVVDRSRRYTSERQDLNRPADREADLAARALFFSPVDAAKIAVPLAELARARGELPRPGAGPGAGAVRVVDLGAGCGSMSLGLMLAAQRLASAGCSDQGPGNGYAPITRWDFTLVDRDAAALAIARRALEHLAAALAVEVTVRVSSADLASFRPTPCELLVAGGVLNELPAAVARAVVTHALASITATGAVLLIDPALRDSARALHTLRDELITSGAANVVAPCVRRCAPCPMLERPTDWCHEDRPFEAPAHVRSVAGVTHLRDGGLKFAYLVLTRDAVPLLPPSPGVIPFRVVSNALPGKGRRELWACGEPGRLPLRRLDRRRSSANAWFDDLHRGDLVEFPADRDPAATKRLEILEDDALKSPRVEP